MSLVIMIFDKSTEITAEKPTYSPPDKFSKLKTDDKAANSYWLTLNDIKILSKLQTKVAMNPEEASKLENFKKPMYVLRLSNSVRFLEA